MKQDIHPAEYRLVIFHDLSSGERFLIGSTVETKDTAKWEDGKEYPLCNIEISSASHPAYTGIEKIVDTAGRVEKFRARAAKAEKEPKSKKTKTEKIAKADETKTEKAPAKEQKKKGKGK